MMPQRVLSIALSCCLLAAAILMAPRASADQVPPAATQTAIAVDIPGYVPGWFCPAPRMTIDQLIALSLGEMQSPVASPVPTSHEVAAPVGTPTPSGEPMDESLVTAGTMLVACRNADSLLGYFNLFTPRGLIQFIGETDPVSFEHWARVRASRTYSKIDEGSVSGTRIVQWVDATVDQQGQGWLTLSLENGNWTYGTRTSAEDNVATYSYRLIKDPTTMRWMVDQIISVCLKTSCSVW